MVHTYFLYSVLDYTDFVEKFLFSELPFQPQEKQMQRKEGSNEVRISWIVSNVNKDERTIRVKRMRTIIED